GPHARTLRQRPHGRPHALPCHARAVAPSPRLIMQKGFFMPRIALAAALSLSLAACTTVSERVVLDPALTPPSGMYAAEVAAVRDYEYDSSRKPLAEIEDIVREISGDPVRTKALADDLANLLLDPHTTYWAKDFA